VRAIQWSNDALSTLLDLYEEKYFAFGPWIFSNQGLGKHSKKACETFLQKLRTTIQCCDKWDKMKKKYFQEKTAQDVTCSTTTSWVWFHKMNQNLEA
jgi:hypothetical protein